MASRYLNITLVQPDIVWEDKVANLARYEQTLQQAGVQRQVVVLPEMFSTGFSMDAARLAEPMEGPTVQWMARMAATHGCIITGSLIIEEDGHYFNRMLWVQPDGVIGTYDKRHLFAYAGEHEHYTAGANRLIVSVGGWRINLLVCYDLRFPVWARNQGAEYDVLLYVANWPEQRSLAWKTLLQARAIENQCYTIGVNRVGTDGKGHHYSGDSSVFGPAGELLWQQSQQEVCHTLALDKELLMLTRQKLPFLADADRFALL